MIKRLMMPGLLVVMLALCLTVGGACGGDGDDGGNGGNGGNGGAQATPTQKPEQPGELPASYKFSMELSDSMGTESEMDFWVKGDKYRTDWTSTAGGEETSMIMLDDGEYAYTYFPDMNQVYKYESASSEMSNPGAQYAEEWMDGYYGDVSEATILAGFQAGCPGGASIAGHESVAGQACTKFTCNFGGGGVSHTWISPNGWPLKAEVTQAGYTYRMQYTNVEMNPNIPDSVFDIDTVAPGAEVMDFTGM
jgi:outer membrane lipoprotein-sorting protein